MFEDGLPIHLRHRELNGNLPLLFAKLVDLHELVEENYNDGHTSRISEILLWIATNHPSVMKGDANLLANISITNLCFRNSYEQLDKLVPTEALDILLNSRVCKELSKFCGYIDPTILQSSSINYVYNLKLALGRHNIDSFIQRPSFISKFYSSKEIVFHLLCGELSENKLKALPILPGYDDKTIYISGASDQDVDWILQAARALNHQGQYEQETGLDCTIKLKCSTISPTGFESIANGLEDINTDWLIRIGETTINWNLGVSSPHIGQTVVEIPGYEESQELYFDRISNNYDIECFSFTDKEYEEEFLCERLVIDV